MDYHYFWTAEGVQASPHVSDSASVGAADKSFLGNELDITAVNKWNANTKVMIGYSNFNAAQTFRRIRTTSTGANDANWAYVQFDVKF